MPAIAGMADHPNGRRGRDTSDGRVYYRSLDPKSNIVRGRADGSGADDDGVYTIRLTTDRPVEIWPGVREILSHDQGAVRMDWVESGNAPVLWMHDRHDQVGVIESAEIRDSSVYVTVRMGTSDRAVSLKNDIAAGIVRNVSVGFRIFDEEITSRSESETVWTVSDWMPLEASFVSIPADHDTGFGRAEGAKCQLSPAKLAAIGGEDETNVNPKTNNRMSQTASADPPAASPPKTIEVVREPDPAEVQRMADAQVQSELARRDAITEMGVKWDMADAARAAIVAKKTAEEFRAEVLANLEQRTGGVSTAEVGLTQSEKKRFSIWNICEALVSGNREAARFEIEVSDEIKKRQGRDSLNSNIALPVDVCVRDIIAGSRIRAMARGELGIGERALVGVGVGNSEAATIVDNELLDEMFIESLRASTVFLSHGVTVLNGLRGDVTIPIELTNPAAYWVGEDAEPTEGDYTLTDLSLVFKTVAARIPFTRKAAKQTTPQIENLLIRSIRQSIAIALDTAAINGAGSATVPQGVLNAAGIGSVVTGGTLSYAKLLQFEESLGNANANTSRSIGFTNTHGKRLLLETMKNAAGGETALGSRVSGDVNAVDTDIGRFFIGNTVPRNLGVGTDKTAMIYGNPAAYFMAMWGGLELNVDTATKIATGGKVIRVFQDVDGRVMQAANFAAAVDIT